MESVLNQGAREPFHALQPSSGDAGVDNEIAELFKPELLYDLLSQVPGMSLYQVKGALLFVGDTGSTFIMHSPRRGPFFVDAQTVRTAFNLLEYDSGELPPGVYRHGITSTGVPWMAIYVPPARYTLNLVGFTQTMLNVHVPMPGFLFLGWGTTYSVWAVKEPVLRAHTPLYYAPLPNIFRECRICWGANAPPQAGGGAMREAWGLFMESKFNGNEVSGRSRSESEDVRNVLASLHQQGARLFPLDDLVPVRGFMQSHLTVGSACDMVGRMSGV